MARLPLSAVVKAHAPPEHGSDAKLSVIDQGVDAIDGGSTSVRSLLLSGNRIASLAGVEEYPEVRVLRLDRNVVRRVEELRRLRSLRHLTNVWFSGCPVAGAVGYREAVLNAMYAEDKMSYRIDGRAVDDDEVEDARNGLFLRRYFTPQLLWLHRLKERIELDARDRRPPAQWQHAAPVLADPADMCGMPRPTAVLLAVARCFEQPEGQTDALVLHGGQRLALASPRLFRAEDVAALERKLCGYILGNPRVLGVGKGDAPPQGGAGAVFGVRDPAVAAMLVQMLQNMYAALCRAAEDRAAALLTGAGLRHSAGRAPAPLHESLYALLATSHGTVRQPRVGPRTEVPVRVPVPATRPTAESPREAAFEALERHAGTEAGAAAHGEASDASGAASRTDTRRVSAAAAIAAKLAHEAPATPMRGVDDTDGLVMSDLRRGSPSLLRGSKADSYQSQTSAHGRDAGRRSRDDSAPRQAGGGNDAPTSDARVRQEPEAARGATPISTRSGSPLAFIDIARAPRRLVEGGAAAAPPQQQPQPREENGSNGAKAAPCYLNLRRVVETEHIVRHEDRIPRPNTKKAGLRLLSPPASPVSSVHEGEWLEGDESVADADQVSFLDAAGAAAAVGVGTVPAATRAGAGGPRETSPRRAGAAKTTTPQRVQEEGGGDVVVVARASDVASVAASSAVDTRGKDCGGAALIAEEAASVSPHTHSGDRRRSGGGGGGGRDSPSADMYEMFARYKQLKDLQQLEQLQRLDDLERLQSLQRLRDLQELQRLDQQQRHLQQQQHTHVDPHPLLDAADPTAGPQPLPSVGNSAGGGHRVPSTRTASPLGPSPAPASTSASAPPPPSSSLSGAGSPRHDSRVGGGASTHGSRAASAVSGPPDATPMSMLMSMSMSTPVSALPAHGGSLDITNTSLARLSDAAPPPSAAEAVDASRGSEGRAPSTLAGTPAAGVVRAPSPASRLSDAWGGSEPSSVRPSVAGSASHDSGRGSLRVGDEGAAQWDPVAVAAAETTAGDDEVDAEADQNTPSRHSPEPEGSCVSARTETSQRGPQPAPSEGGSSVGGSAAMDANAPASRHSATPRSACVASDASAAYTSMSPPAADQQGPPASSVDDSTVHSPLSSPRRHAGATGDVRGSKDFSTLGTLSTQTPRPQQFVRAPYVEPSTHETSTAPDAAMVSASALLTTGDAGSTAVAGTPRSLRERTRSSGSASPVGAVEVSSGRGGGSAAVSATVSVGAAAVGRSSFEREGTRESLSSAAGDSRRDDAGGAASAEVCVDAVQVASVAASSAAAAAASAAFETSSQRSSRSSRSSRAAPRQLPKHLADAVAHETSTHSRRSVALTDAALAAAGHHRTRTPVSDTGSAAGTASAGMPASLSLPHATRSDATGPPRSSTSTPIAEGTPPSVHTPCTVSNTTGVAASALTAEGVPPTPHSQWAVAAAPAAATTGAPEVSPATQVSPPDAAESTAASAEGPEASSARVPPAATVAGAAPASTACGSSVADELSAASHATDPSGRSHLCVDLHEPPPQAAVAAKEGSVQDVSSGSGGHINSTPKPHSQQQQQQPLASALPTDTHPREVLHDFWVLLQRTPPDLLGAREAAKAAVRRALSLEGACEHANGAALVEGVVVAEDAAMHHALANRCYNLPPGSAFNLEHESDVALSYQLLRDVTRNPTGGVMIEMELATIRSSLNAGAKLEEARMIALRTLATSMRVLASSESRASLSHTTASLRSASADDSALRHKRRARRTSRRKDRSQDSTLLDIAQNLSDAGVMGSGAAGGRRHTADRHYRALLMCKMFSKWKKQWSIRVVERALASVRGQCAGYQGPQTAEVWRTARSEVQEVLARATGRADRMPAVTPAPVRTAKASLRALSPATVMRICKTPQVSSGTRGDELYTRRRSTSATRRDSRSTAPGAALGPKTVAARALSPKLYGDRPSAAALYDVLGRGKKSGQHGARY